MEARALSSHPEAIPFPLLGDATTLGMPDPVWRNFTTVVDDITAAVWHYLPVAKQEDQQLRPTVSTGPSETRILPSALDVTEDREEGVAMLEIAAGAGDEAAFVQAAGETDWSRRPAADFVRAVYLALAAGAHLMARKLADQGHRLYPDHEELAEMARILAPPRVVRTGLPPVLSIRANRAWLQAHADEYRGQWVALRNGQLLAVGSTARELKAQLESIEGVLLTRAL